MTEWLRYVPLHSVGAYLAAGWRLVDDLSNTHHGAHAVLMLWDGEGEPR